MSICHKMLNMQPERDNKLFDRMQSRRRTVAGAAFSKKQLLALFGKRLWEILLIFLLPSS